MKKFNLFKKIGVCALSLATALSIGGACLTANVSAATHTPNYSVTAKDDAYLEGLFVGGAGTTIEASYSAPEYMKVATEYANGVALTFDGTGGSIVTKNAYKVSDLVNGITFVPVLRNASDLQNSADIGELEISFFEEAVAGGSAYRKNKITVRINANGGGNGWAKSGWTGVSAAAETLSGPTAMPRAQMFAGYTVSTATVLANTKYAGKVMLRKEPIGARLDVGLAGKTTGTVPFKFGYIEYKEAYKSLIDHDNDPSTPSELTDLERNNTAIITANHFDATKIDAQIGTMDYTVKSDRSGSPYPAGSFDGMHFLRRLGTTDLQADSDVGGSLLTGDDVVFEGFSANAEVKMEIKALSGAGTILVSNLCGESLKSEIRVANAYNGYVGYNYTIPTPKFYLNNPAGDAFTGSVVVKDAQGNVVPNDNKINDYLYNFTTAGKYVATFTQTSGAGTYGGSYSFEILPADAEKLSLSLAKQISPAQCIVGMSVNVGATVSSPIYAKDDLSYVDLTVISPSGKEEFTNIEANKIYTFNEEGTYLLKYYAIDSVFTATTADRDDDGNIANNRPLVNETIVTCNVKRNYFALEIPENSRYSLGDEVNNLIINKNIVSFFDGAYGRNFYENATSYAFEVKVPGATDYVQISSEEFENGYNFADGVFDDYNFRIQINYAVGGKNYTIPAAGEYLEFTVTVVDGMQPVIYGASKEMLFGGTLVSKQGQLYTYEATVGTTVGFSKFYAYDVIGEDDDGDLTENIILSLTKDGQAIDGVNALYLADRENFTYQLNEAGSYIFKFDVTDGYNDNYICVIVEVANEFYTIVTNANFNSNYTTSDALVVNSFKVLNSKNVEATNVTKKFVVYYNNGKVGEFDSLCYNPTKAGYYKVELVATVSGVEVDKLTYEFAVTDATAPVLTIEGKIFKQVTLGDEIEIATVIGVDNNDSSLDLVNMVSVTRNGATINTYNGKFTPIESGVYVVKLTSTDLSGNVGVYTYEIEVLEPASNEGKIFGVDALVFILGVLGVALIVASVVVFLKVIKKKPTTEDEIAE